MDLYKAGISSKNLCLGEKGCEGLASIGHSLALFWASIFRAKSTVIYITSYCISL